VLDAVRAAGFDLILVETAGIGQGDAAILPHVDASLYVMTPEFGAASQLEKIDMLDFADFVAINKFDRKGAEDALRDVRKQVQRNREAFRQKPDEMPVYGTVAARFNDDGVTALYQAHRREAEGEGTRGRRRQAAAGARPHVVRGARGRSRESPALPRRDRRDACAAITSHARSSRASRATASSLAREGDARKAGKDARARLAYRGEANALDRAARKLLDAWPETSERIRATSTS
jgi:methylmalonyl-CoA mutase